MSKSPLKKLHNQRASRLIELMRRIFLGAVMLCWFFGVKTGSAVTSITFQGQITSFTSSFPGPSILVGDHFTGSASFAAPSIPSPPFDFSSLSISLGFGAADTTTASGFINSTAFSLGIVTPIGYSPIQGLGFVYSASLSGSFVTGNGSFYFSGIGFDVGNNLAGFSLSGDITKITSSDPVPDMGGTAQLLCLSASVMFAAQRLRLRQTKM
jgi:hypothetical protein